MLTEDIILASNGNWTAIPLTSSATVLYNCSGHDIMMRMGVASTSSGFKLKPCGTVAVDETVYVRPTYFSSNQTDPIKLNVTR